MEVDICYYAVDVPKAGVRKGRHIEDRPAGSSWGKGETTGALAVANGLEISQDDLGNLRDHKWLLVPGKKGKWSYTITDPSEWLNQPETDLEV